MRDPVALAWSGRVPEARELAVEQAESDDELAAGQGLEALGVLGHEHGVRADARIERLLVRRASEGGRLARRAFEAAMGLESRCLEAMTCAALETGVARWELLRYAGELPSIALAGALARGWNSMPDSLLDEALVTACSMPAANHDECVAWGERALAASQHERESVRVAAFIAIRVWTFGPAIDRCREALDDDSPLVIREARSALDLLTRVENESNRPADAARSDRAPR